MHRSLPTEIWSLQAFVISDSRSSLRYESKRDRGQSNFRKRLYNIAIMAPYMVLFEHATGHTALFRLPSILLIVIIIGGLSPNILAIILFRKTVLVPGL